MSEYAIDMKNHPLQGEYQETMEIIRELRPKTEGGDPELSRRLDLLEDRASELTKRMALEVGVPDEKLTNPLWQEWDEKWKTLREAKFEEDSAQEREIWQQIKVLGKKLHPEMPEPETTHIFSEN